jgi:hypothetical protein
MVTLEFADWAVMITALGLSAGIATWDVVTARKRRQYRSREWSWPWRDENEETEMTDATMIPSTSDQRTANNAMRHAYRVLSDEEKARMQAIKDKGLELLDLINECGQSRELSIARTKTEEAVMWAVKHVTA